MPKSPLNIKPGDQVIIATKPGLCAPSDPHHIGPSFAIVASVNNRSIRISNRNSIFNAQTLIERNAYGYPLQMFLSMDEYLAEKNCLHLNQKIKQHIAFNPLSYQEALAIAKILDIST